MPVEEEEKIVEEEEEVEEENGDVYEDEKMKKVPDTIEKIYSELDAIKTTLTEVAEAIRSSAEAQKAITEAMEKQFSSVMKALESFSKMEMPEEVDREREKEKYVRPKEPEGVKPTSEEERADDIAEPKRVARYRMPDYLGGEDEEEVEKAEIKKRAAAVVETPRPETDIRKEPRVGQESVDIIKQILGANKIPSMEELTEIMKKNYDVRKLV